MKKTLFFLSFLLFTFFVSRKTLAADIEVICSDAPSNSCNIVSGSLLFSESNWVPGSTATKTLKITNNDHNDNCELRMVTTQNNLGVDTELLTPDLAGRLFTALKKDGNTFYGNYETPSKAGNSKSLQDIFVNTIDMGSIHHNGGIGDYEWTLTFDSNTGNEYQNKKTKFDITLNFSCSHEANNNNNEGGGTTGGTGTVLSANQSTAGNIFYEIPSLLGVMTEALVTPGTTSTTSDVTPEVKGAETNICVDVWFWILLAFLIQIIVHLIVYVLLGRNHAVNRKLYYALQCVATALFTYFFYKNFCIWWDVLVSVGIGILTLIMSKLMLKRILLKNKLKSRHQNPGTKRSIRHGNKKPESNGS